MTQSRVPRLSVKQRLHVKETPWKRTDSAAPGDEREVRIARAVALAAQPDDRRAVRERGSGDRQVLRAGGQGLEVMAPRPVAPFAADRGIGRLGPRPGQDRIAHSWYGTPGSGGRRPR